MNLNSKILELTKNLLMDVRTTGFSRGEEFSSPSGRYFCDCSSYINSILKMINPRLYNLLLEGDKRLKACDYFDLAINDHRSVSYHQFIYRLEVGEILVWKKSNIPKSGDTGHMAIVLSHPVEVEKGRYKVLVSDCSKLLHDRDSRKDSGVGSGELVLITNIEGLITGYIWSKDRPKNKITDVLCISFSDNLIK